MRPESFKIDLENICNTLFGKPAPVLYALGCGFFWNSETQRIESSGIQFPDEITPVYSRKERREIQRAVKRFERHEHLKEDKLWNELYTAIKERSPLNKHSCEEIAGIVNQLGKNSLLRFFPWAIRHIADDILSDSELRKNFLEPGAFTRERIIDLSDVFLFLLTMAGDSMNNEVYEYFKIKREHPSTSAMVQRRSQLKAEGVKYFLERITDICGMICRCLPDDRNTDELSSRFDHILACDGSGINVAYDPEDTLTYVDLGEGKRGYNQYHLTSLRDDHGGLFVSSVLQPVRELNEPAAAVQMVRNLNLKGRSLFEGDRGFGSLNLVETINRKYDLEYLIRVKEGWLTEFRTIPMAEYDGDVTIHVITTQRNCDKERVTAGKAKYLSGESRYGKYKTSKTWDYESEVDVVFRVVRFQLNNGEFETLITSLKREEFNIEELRALYYKRWSNIEKGFRILKWDNHLSQLHSRLDNSARQEIYARIAMHNIVSCIIEIANCMEPVVMCIKAFESKDDSKKGRPALHEHIINRRFATHLVCDFLRSDDVFDFDVIRTILRYKSPVRKGRSFKRDLRIIGFVSFFYR